MPPDTCGGGSVRSLGSPIVRVGSVTSTMDVTRRLAELGAAEGTTVIAETQTQGRGRAGRSWSSPPGTGLYASIILTPEMPAVRLQPLSIVTGLAVCAAIDPDRRLGVELKWPNDLLAGGKKLGGLLITTSVQGDSVESAIAGIGLNVLPDHTRPEVAVSLAELVNHEIPESKVLMSGIAQSLAARYSALCAGDPERALAGWRDRLALLDQPVTLQDSDIIRPGTLRGIDASGALLLETESGVIAVHTGDLTRGPATNS